MSHIVQVQTEVRDPAAIDAACRRLGLGPPQFGEAKLFSGSKTGWQVQLPEWRYPVVIDVDAGRIEFDNYEGRWGDRRQLDRFLQAYAVEKAKLESRKLGRSVTERQLADGSVKVTIHLEGAA